ncbi:MAG: GTPase HflX [Candidatus Omnitrophica bacterium]|nr:GTPase HflX [Candidatus Omnitrophota bacterium]
MKETIELRKKERALLVVVRFDTSTALSINPERSRRVDTDRDQWQPEDYLDELKELTRTTGCLAAGEMIVVRDKPTPNFFIGKGKVEEIREACLSGEIDTVIFSHNLGGTQQRNLEELIGKKVIDRTQLILDIFARHARSQEGKAQVELAQLEYLIPRLTGKGIMLSRLGGGIGTRGPGEKKLEVDRRRIRKRIEKLRDELGHMRDQRALMRKKRHASTLASAALVGYTNAGKSTLINSLTSAAQEVKGLLFTTLDPLSRALTLPNGQHIVISDTVGFLHQLPHGLIEAFKATLEEVIEADLLINVLDISHRQAPEHRKAVLEVLGLLGCAAKPMITALNKIDKLDDRSWIERFKVEFPDSVAISAKTGENLEGLLHKIEEKLSFILARIKLSIPMNRLSVLDMIYKEGKVLSVEYGPEEAIVDCVIPAVDADKIKGRAGVRVIN